MRRIALLIAALLATTGAAPLKPHLSYRLSVDRADLTGFRVEIHLRNLPDTVRLAMAAHPEYDDRFRRQVRDFSVTGPGGAIRFERPDSAVWSFVAPGGEAVVRYRIELPAPEAGERPAWKPFLTPTGGLVGGPHSFMYVVGIPGLPAEVALELPAGWRAATALEPVRSGGYVAMDPETLMESPVLVGEFSEWRFRVAGVPHRVVYWPAPGAAAFDTVAFVGNLERLTREAVALFGRPPYREYTFIFQDNAWGGLEHPASVTLGVSSRRLAESVHDNLEETAHEFIHTWNLLRIRPEEYGGVDYRPQRPTAGLWFSEGLTLFYADLLLRRAGLPVEEASRGAHLEGLIARYLSSPGNARFSAEQVSRVAYNASPAPLGDYTASTHLQGEVIGAMLDLIVRDATGGRRSMDDVMRLMLARSGARGFSGADVERAVAEVCGCDAHEIFERHVRGAAPIDFDRYLALAGMRAEVVWAPAVDREGRPAVELGGWGYDLPGGGVAIGMRSPETSFGRAGLHAHDEIETVNDTPIRRWPDLRRILGSARIGDTLRFVVRRPTRTSTHDVVMSGFNRPVVHLVPLAGATPRARAIREAWSAGR